MEKSFHNNANDVDMSFPPPSMTRDPRGYALRGKIMLSAIIILFSVVVIMVCLHIYARWYILRTRRRNIRRARRRTHLVFYIDPTNPSNITSVSRGLDPTLLKSLPTFTFTKSEKTPRGSDDDVADLLECAVCLSEFEENEVGRMLPKCNHCFHVECIDMWFYSHDTCPLCRAPVEAADLAVKGVENEVVVELGELSPSQLGEVNGIVGPSRSVEVEPSSSFGGRRKGLDLIEVPTRCRSFSFTNLDESGPSHGFRSPTSRILSLRRILSREKKSPLPSPSQSVSELDVELGRVDPETPPSQSLTPR